MDTSYGFEDMPSLGDALPAAAAATDGTSTASATGGGKLLPPASSTRGDDANKVSLLLLSSVKDVCGGVIASTGAPRFCTRGGDCPAAAHKRTKAALKAGHLYIMGKNANQAKLEPSLDSALLPTDVVVAELTSKKQSANLWKAFFGGIQANVESGYGVVNDLPSVDDYSRADDFNTPKKVVTYAADVKAMLSPLVKDSLPVAASSDLISDGLENATDKATATVLTNLLREWDIVNSNLAKIRLSQSTIVEKQDKAIELSDKTVTNLKASVDDLHVKMQLVSSAIGISNDGDSTWEAINGLLQTIKIIQNDIGKIDSSSIDAFIQTWNSSLPNMANTLQQLAKHYRENFPQIIKTIKELKLTSVSSGFESGLFGDASTSGDEIAALRDEIKQIRDQITGEGVAMTPTTGMGVDVANRLTKLEIKVADLEDRFTEQSYTVGTTTFSSQADVAEWIKDNNITDVGLFWDLFSAMVAMQFKRQQTGKELADTSYSSKRVGTSVQESDLLAAMGHPLPSRLFAKDGTGKAVSWDEGLAAAPTWKDWMTGEFSEKVKVNREFRGYIHGISGSYTKNQTAASMLLEHHLRVRMHAQWDAISSFMESYFLRLTDSANFSKANSWLLVGRCVGAIFTSLTPPRDLVAQFGDLSREEYKVKMLWSVLQCHRMLDRYIAVGFHSHPEIVRIVNMYMITHRVDPTEVTKLSTQISTLEKEKAALKTTVKSMEDKFAGWKRTLDNLSNEVTQIKKKAKN
mmetsp:Transcript_17572/g.49641  ORF Transcript_17572/g.49641 Transcript_17572/m.49641 type:complete len:747 (+) Transcript_17572:8178-10418(+)